MNDHEREIAGIRFFIGMCFAIWLILELHWIRVALEGMVGK